MYQNNYIPVSPLTGSTQIHEHTHTHTHTDTHTQALCYLPKPSPCYFFVTPPPAFKSITLARRFYSVDGVLVIDPNFISYTATPNHLPPHTHTHTHTYTHKS